MAKATGKKQRPVEYLPPTYEAAHAYARAICGKMAERHDPSYADSEIIRGLAEFMQIAGKIQAKHLNRANRVDNDAE
jgi:hypothetical protein